MKVPVVQGFWPAFWSLGTALLTEGWPACGEIDIMEVFGTRRGTAACATVHNLLHSWGTRDPLPGDCVALDVEPEWHIWKLLWTPTEVAFFFDDDETTPFWRYERKPDMPDEAFPYTEPQYLIANLVRSCLPSLQFCG